jgi:hypothetical protein
MSDKQIRLARRFVSGFIYKTDATFSTNTLRLPLLVMVGIDNTRTTFPMAYMFITSKSAESFRFASRQLTDLCFYDCPKAAIICGDFSKGLGLAIALKAREDAGLAGRLRRLGTPRDDDFVDIDDREALEIERIKSLLEGETIVVDVGVGDNSARIILQLCEWHAIKAIKRRLVHLGQYSKESKEEIIDLLNKWIKAPTICQIEEAQKTLLAHLYKDKREYLIKYYQPKELQFCRA